MARTPLRALDALQHRLSQLITGPDGVAAALAPGEDLAALVRGGAAAPCERVSVYANAYFARLHDCLKDDFGATACALGPDAFHDLVKSYLMIHPPSRPSLRDCGAHLAEHLATPPFAEIFARRCPYAADLARLEWALALAFAAPDGPVLARGSLAEIAPEAWAGLRFTLTPSLHVLTCAWPVEIARERFEREGEDVTFIEPLGAEPTTIRVWRCDERVRFARIGADESSALEAARAGESFAGICERLAAAVGEEGAAARAAALLESWIADGLLADVRR